jgi:hypothetical protein
MKQNQTRSAQVALVCAALFLFPVFRTLHADQLEMQNGDRYVGKVLSLNSNTIVLQSEVLGTINLPREKVTAITLGAGSAKSSKLSPTNKTSLTPSLNSASTAAEPAPALRQIATNTSLIKQVQSQFLADAGPEATAKFNELLDGLSTGRISMNDLRAQAKSAADQLRNLKRDVGDDAGFAVDGYLDILDSFLKQVPASGATITHSTTALPKAKPGKDADEE